MSYVNRLMVFKDVERRALDLMFKDIYFSSNALDHGLLRGLADDDHPLYLLASDATSRASFATNWTDLTDAGASTLHKHDHGGQDGLSDDDHTQYLLADGTRAITHNGGGISFVRSGSDTWLLGQNTSTTFTIKNTTDGRDDIFINGTGQIGLGTNAFLTTEKVNINGALVMQGRITAPASTPLQLTGGLNGTDANSLFITHGGFFGVGIALPDTKAHIILASAGTVSALAGSVLTIENDGNTYLQILSPDGTDKQGILFGDEADVDQGQLIFDHGSNRMEFVTDGTNVDVAMVGGNVGIRTGSFGTNAKGVIAILRGTVPATSPADSIQIYAEDVSSSTEFKVRDEAGNVTVLSPHNFNLFTPDSSYQFPWSYSSQNAYVGKEINVDMYGVVKAIEKLSGKKFMYLRNLQRNERQDWGANQNHIYRKKSLEDTFYRKKPEPLWIKNARSIRIGENK